MNEFLWKYYYIYKITNLINNKIYVGQRKTNNNPYEDNYFGSGKILLIAIKKYGKRNFKKEIIEFCDDWKSLNKCEIFWINKLNTIEPDGYNLCKGGLGGISCGKNHPFYNKHRSYETKEKIRKKLKERKRTKEAINKQKETLKLHPRIWTDESRRKCSESHIDKKQSNEHLEALSKVRKGKSSPMKGMHHTEEAKEKNRLKHIGKIPVNAKKVNIFTLRDDYIETCNSLRQLYLKYKLNSQYVRDCCNNKKEFYNNYIFKWYINDVEI